MPVAGLLAGGFDPADVDDVVCGNGSHAGDHAHDIGRMAVLDAGWPVSVPGVTLNRFCGSGQQAVTFAAMGVGAGHQDLVIGAAVATVQEGLVRSWVQTASAAEAGNALGPAVHRRVDHRATPESR